MAEDNNNPQASATRQLGNIPFGTLIGGPLTAAVEAQAKAAQSSVSFIEAVAFEGEDQESIRNVTFSYQGVDGQTQQLVVPILTIVPIPFIRIDDMTIGFKANLNASYSSKKDSTATATANSKYSVEYTMDINVHAVQDDMPAGMAKVLNILNDSITANAKSD